MGQCYLCEQKPTEKWGGYWCAECRQLKNLGNVYGFERVLDILKKCCIRNESQLEAKIESQKSVNEIKTRSKKTEHN
tara:strand:- start:1029 stop:1259 length:231 start_codon:yes stop_codon:yes gene_type:complete